MKHAFPLATTAIAALITSNFALAAAHPHWGYAGEISPEHWGELAKEFSICGTGQNQAPVNLTGMVEGELEQLKFNYSVGGTEVVNNGHSIQVNYTPGSTFELDGHSFELKQFHFHSPSENNIEGESFPMEGHFVHADKEGNLAVIAVMYKIGEFNKELAKAWEQLPMETGDVTTLTTPMNAKNLMPEDPDYYRFNGSLTTPPCSEGVNWVVMKAYDTASKEQLESFVTSMHHHDNNRPVQPLNARVVIK